MDGHVHSLHRHFYMKRMDPPMGQSQKKTAKKAPGKRRLVTDILMLAVLVVGVLALLYPFVSDKVNEILDQQLISYYQHKANRENEAALEKIKAAQEAQNKKIAKEGTNPGTDPFAEEKAKDQVKPTKTYYQTHTIGVIRIPKIDVKIPIFDRTTDVFLAKGASLLEGTSYPTGGENTHSVISAHRGLPEAKLFTDLPELAKGDTFFIEINKETHAYEVDQIKTIEPTDTSDMKLVEGADLITLMTCTPYMINSHRLLVRGHRIPYVPEMKKEIEKSDNQRQLKQILILAGAVAAVVLLAVIIWRWIRSVQIRNRRYELKLGLLDEAGQPLSAITLGLFTKNGKHPITRDGAPLTATSDEAGVVQLPDLRGGKYLVRSQNRGAWQLVAQVKKPKDRRFTLRSKQKQISSVTETHVDYPVFTKKK